MILHQSLPFICLFINIPMTFSVTIEDVMGCWNTPSDNRCCRRMRTDTLPNLDIAYDCRNPDNVTIIQPRGTNWTLPFKLFHSNLCITSLPQNICEYPNIVSIQIVSSSVKSIGRLSCLKNLMALDLSSNEIEILKNDTFTGLSRLYFINLMYNRIKYIEPYTFKEDLNGLMFVLLGNNRLTTVEAFWIMSITHYFCYFGLSHNSIVRFSNEANWRFNRTQVYGPGYLDLSYNLFTIWITEQLKMYGFDDMRSLGIFLTWGIDFRNNSWKCDCKMHEYRKLLANYQHLVKRTYHEVYCEKPPHLKGTRIIDVPFAELVCNITKMCPVECLCQNQPEMGLVFIDCHDGELTRMPLALPQGNLKLLLSNNSIKSLDVRPYLDRVEYIDLSNNGLRHISADAVGKLQNMAKMVNLSHNNIKRLPKNIQNFPLTKLDLGDNVLICDCSSTWMSNWLRQYSRDENISRIKCHTSEEASFEIVSATDMHLDCDVYPVSTVVSVFLGVLALIFITTVIVLIVFRYEVMLLVTLKRKLKHMDGEVFDYHVLISVDEDSGDDRMWTSLTLLPELEQKHHLRVYYPPRDMDPGSVTVHEFIEALKKSSAALIVLSDNYAANPTTVYQFLEAYKIMLKQYRGKLIIVRYTNVEKASNGYLNAFIRLKKYLDKDQEDLLTKIVNNVRNEISTYPQSQIHRTI